MESIFDYKEFIGLGATVLTTIDWWSDHPLQLSIAPSETQKNRYSIAPSTFLGTKIDLNVGDTVLITNKPLIVNPDKEKKNYTTLVAKVEAHEDKEIAEAGTAFSFKTNKRIDFSEFEDMEIPMMAVSVYKPQKWDVKPADSLPEWGLMEIFTWRNSYIKAINDEYQTALSRLKAQETQLRLELRVTEEIKANKQYKALVELLTEWGKRYDEEREKAAKTEVKNAEVATEDDDATPEVKYLGTRLPKTLRTRVLKEIEEGEYSELKPYGDLIRESFALGIPPYELETSMQNDLGQLVYGFTELNTEGMSREDSRAAIKQQSKRVSNYLETDSVTLQKLEKLQRDVVDLNADFLPKQYRAQQVEIEMLAEMPKGLMSLMDNFGKQGRDAFSDIYVHVRELEEKYDAEQEEAKND